MSAVWSGHLHFGLVVMAVRLLVAARTKTTRFRRLHRKAKSSLPATSFASITNEAEDRKPYVVDEDEVSNSLTEDRYLPSSRESSSYEYGPVRQVLQSEASGEEIGPGELFKAYEFAPNQFAVIDPQEIRAAEVETSDTIDLFHFVKSADVDPIYFERSYYVAPDPGAEKVYGLLLEAMRRQDCFGIARIGMHRREHMLILRPAKDCLVAHTMFYANEVRPAPHLDFESEFKEKELSMAGALIQGYAGTFEPEQFKDLYQERIHKVIAAQLSSNELRTPAALQQSTRPIPDIMESIRLSLAQIEAKKSPAKTEKKSAQKSAPLAKKKPQKVRA